MRKLSTVFLFCLALSLFSDQTWDFRDGDLHGFRPYNFIEYDLVPGEGFVSVGQNNAYCRAGAPTRANHALPSTLFSLFP